MKIGAVNFPSLSKADIESNARRHLDIIKTAHQQGIRFLVFPELSLTGHRGYRNIPQRYLEQNSPVILQLAEAAGEMTIIVGLTERTTQGFFYNSAFMLGNGKITNIHRKINLATYGKLNDGRYYARGTKVSVAPEMSPPWHPGILICNDTWDPSLVHLSVLQKMTLLAVPFSSSLEAVEGGFDNPRAWDMNLNFYALTYGLSIVAANHTGKDGLLTFWGGSRIIAPGGETLVMADRRPGIVSAEINFETLAEKRHQLPIARDLNPDFTEAELRRINRTRNQS